MMKPVHITIQCTLAREVVRGLIYSELAGMAAAGEGPFLFPSDRIRGGHQTTFETVWRRTLRRAKIPYFRIYDLRPTYATRLSAGGVADEMPSSPGSRRNITSPRLTSPTCIRALA